MLSHSPRIVTDNIVLYLDARNKRSYPGSGTTWFDISGNNNHATMGNAPSFNAGTFTFTTSNYMEVTDRKTQLEFQPTQPYSLCCWVKGLENGTGAIFSNMLTSAPYTGWDIWRNGSNAIAIHLISSFAVDAVKIVWPYDYTAYANRWNLLCFTYDGSSPTTVNDCLNSMDFYLNGELITTGKANNTDGADGFPNTSATISYNSSQRVRINGRWTNGSVAVGSQQTLAAVQIYQRKLSAGEAMQNFQALRGSFDV